MNGPHCQVASAAPHRPAALQWVIVRSEADRHATEVGGCSDGPEVVDLQQKIYWTC